MKSNGYIVKEFPEFYNETRGHSKRKSVLETPLWNIYFQRLTASEEQNWRSSTFSSRPCLHLSHSSHFSAHEPLGFGDVRDLLKPDDIVSCDLHHVNNITDGH